MRAGRVFRRCRACSRAVDGRRCGRCGSDRVAWAAQFDTGAAGDRRRQVMRSGFETKAAAVAAMVREQQRAASGASEPTRLTLGEWLDEWLPSARGRVRGGTLLQYRFNIEHYLKPRIGDVPLRSLTRARLRTAYGELADSGGRTGGPLSRKSVHNVHLVVHRSLRDAVEEGVIERNPADGAHSLGRDSRRTVAAWDGSQVAAFLAATTNDRLAAMWRLAFIGGLRRGELLALRWSDLDLDAGCLSVARARVRGEAGEEWGNPKTRSGRRRVTIDPVTVAALRSHRARQNGERLAIGSGWVDEDLVFCREDGSPIGLDTATTAFGRLVAGSGLPRISLHGTRHTAASVLLAAGVNPRVVQLRLGHSSVQVTLDLYSHVTPAVEEDAAARLALAIDGG